MPYYSRINILFFFPGETRKSWSPPLTLERVCLHSTLRTGFSKSHKNALHGFRGVKSLVSSDSSRKFFEDSKNRIGRQWKSYLFICQFLVTTECTVVHKKMNKTVFWSIIKISFWYSRRGIVALHIILQASLDKTSKIIRIRKSRWFLHSDLLEL